MKRKEKIVLFAMAFVLAAGMLMASGGQAAAPAGAGAALVTPNGEFPVVKEKVSLTFFAPQPPRIENLTTNDFTVEYEKKTNVHINWEIVPSAALPERRNLSLASGDYPDVYFGAGITLNDEMMYGGRPGYLSR